MCGITGYINPNGITEEEIYNFTSVLRHRGPDDYGIYTDQQNQIGLGHVRLSIIDLSGGKQPMPNEDETIWITFNGEIYNYQELKKDLTEKHNFRTKSERPDSFGASTTWRGF